MTERLRLGLPARASSSPIEIGEEGLAIALLGVAPGIEIAGASLSLRAPAADARGRVEPADPGCLAESSAGPGLGGEAAVAWVSVRWRGRRPLLGIELHAHGQATHARLKIADDGPWNPPVIERLALAGGLQALPELPATGVLVELCADRDGRSTPSTAIGTSISVEVGRWPVDLQIAVGDRPPIAVSPGPMAAGGRFEVRQGLARELAEAHARGAPLHLVARASSASSLAGIDVSLTLQRTLRRFADGAAARTLALAGGEAASAEIPLAPGDRVASLTLAVGWRFPAEAAAPLPSAVDERDAHRLRPTHVAAQRLAVRPGPSVLVGVDLHLRPLAGAATLRLSVRADHLGAPAEGRALAEVAIELDDPGAPPHTGRWIAATFAAPLGRGADARWLCLEAIEGEALWTLAPVAPRDGRGIDGPPAALHRRAGERWAPRSPIGAALDEGVLLEALHRPRLRADRPAPAPRLALRQVGDAREHPLEIDGEGRVRAAEATLAALADAPPASGLEIVARADLTGEVELRDLELRLAPTVASDALPREPG